MEAVFAGPGSPRPKDNLSPHWTLIYTPSMNWYLLMSLTNIFYTTVLLLVSIKWWCLRFLANRVQYPCYITGHRKRMDRSSVWWAFDEENSNEINTLGGEQIFPTRFGYILNSKNILLLIIDAVGVFSVPTDCTAIIYQTHIEKYCIPLNSGFLIHHLYF